MRIFIMLSLLCLSHASYGCQLIVRMENFSPESQINSNKSWQGIDVELTKKLLENTGCQFSIVELPWARSLEMLANGDIDMMINVSKTERRDALYHFVGPIRNEVIVLAKDANTPVKLSELSDIFTLDKPVAIQRGSYYGPVIERMVMSEAGKESFVQLVENDTKLTLMKTGRITGFLEAKRNLTIGPEQTARYKGIWFHPLVIHQSPIYFALSKKSINEALLQRLQVAFNTHIRK